MTHDVQRPKASKQREQWVSLKEPRPSGSGFTAEFHSLTLAALFKLTQYQCGRCTSHPQRHWNDLMVRHVDAIYSQGAFRPLEPLALSEGTRVHLSIEEEAIARPVQSLAQIHTPKLPNPEDAANFLMEVRQA